MAKKKPVPSYVEYNHNNSGGRWWLSDKHWRDLELAGWKIVWARLEHAYTDDGGYARDKDGTPTLVPVGTVKQKFPSFNKPDENGEYRYLGALAATAYKVGATSIRDAADEWERITGLNSTDAGCACCGQPHRFTLYIGGKWSASGPDTEYVARWA